MKTIREEVEALLKIVPKQVRTQLLKLEEEDEVSKITNLIEIHLDIGRHPSAFFLSDEEKFSTRGWELEDIIIKESDLTAILQQLQEFKLDNRTGIEGTLHRISALVDRYNKVTALTLRVGKTVENTEWGISDLVEKGQNILLVGPPGSGKTTTLRGVARVCSEDLVRRTLIVDTSDEIAGFGKIPHPSVGKARKMSVPIGKEQSEMLLQAVQNHTPEVLISDEIGSEADVKAILTGANRGVQIIASVHGTDLNTVIENPVLSNLLGGIKSVTITDMEATKRGTNKSVRERQYQPPFNTVVILKSYGHILIYENVAEVVDDLLRGVYVEPQERVMDGNTFKVLHPQRVFLPRKLEPITSRRDSAKKEPVPKREFRRK